MKQSGVLLLTLLVAAASIIATAKYVGDRRYNEGYNNASSNNLDLSTTMNSVELQTEKANYQKLLDDYNKLATDYNNLRDAAIRAIGAAAANSYKPVSCYSNSYGIDYQYTTTRCY